MLNWTGAMHGCGETLVPRAEGDEFGHGAFTEEEFFKDWINHQTGDVITLGPCPKCSEIINIRLEGPVWDRLKAEEAERTQEALEDWARLRNGMAEAPSLPWDGFPLGKP